MLDVGSFIYSTLSNDATLISLIGSTDNLSASYPDTVTTFPYVIFREDDQTDYEFADNLPTGVETNFVIDVFVKDDTPTPIAIAIANIFKPLFWSMTYNSDVPEPDAAIRHRVMRFNRVYFNGEI